VVLRHLLISGFVVVRCVTTDSVTDSICSAITYNIAVHIRTCYTSENIIPKTDVKVSK